MPLVLQNLIVFALVAACVLFIARSAYRALQGRKSRLAGCGTCNSCQPAADANKPKPAPVQMISADALLRKRK